MAKTKVESRNYVLHNIRYPSSRMEGLMAINKRHEMGAQVRNTILNEDFFIDTATKSDIVIPVICEQIINSYQSHIQSIVIHREKQH